MATSLVTRGSLYQSTKRGLMASLENSSEQIQQAPGATCMLIDRAVVVQMLKPRMTKTLDEYAQQVFIPYLAIQL